ncbi:sugar ABC transporter substrate-binding protein, partial [Candidatus Bipolaricaulota bacterium]|nr:sugar ABC transporter substrate-binding protein [Candidatus Bipolaricaulota bacterium]
VAYSTIPSRKGVDDKTVAETGGFGLAIPANAGETDKKAAFLLMQWMTSKEVERELMTEYGVQIVDRESLMREPELQEQFPEYKVMVEQVQLADPAWRPAIPEWPEVETEYFGTAVNKVLTGQKEPKQAMEDIFEPVREIMEEAGYYE